jgi:excisionase family DNA binding protein
MNDDALMATREVAERLGVSIATVNRMAKDGRLTPALRTPGIRGAHLYDRNKVEALEQEMRTAP